MDTQSTLKTFEGGHVGFVSSLAVVTSSTHNCYVITGGNNVQKDHTLTVWPLVRATRIMERHKDQENSEFCSTVLFGSFPDNTVQKLVPAR